MRLEVRRVRATGPLAERMAARMEDFHQAGDRILELGRIHREQYRKKICVKCDHAQRVRRDCASLHEGCEGTLECGHMNRAFYQKHKREIRGHLNMHPLMERINMNARLAK